MLAHWMYTSQAAYPSAEADAQMEAIEAVSTPKNLELGVTGALIFAGERIAQCIEGEAAAVALLRAEIEADPRHREIRTLAAGAVETRGFDRWCVGYRGIARYVERSIITVNAQAAEAPETAAIALRRLLQGFSATG